MKHPPKEKPLILLFSANRNSAPSTFGSMISLVGNYPYHLVEPTLQFQGLNKSENSSSAEKVVDVVNASVKLLKDLIGCQFNPGSQTRQSVNEMKAKFTREAILRSNPKSHLAEELKLPFYSDDEMYSNMHKICLKSDLKIVELSDIFREGIPSKVVLLVENMFVFFKDMHVIFFDEIDRSAVLPG